MLIDWLVYGLLIWGLAALLNATAFARNPASRTAAWAITVMMFFINLAAMSALQFIRYQTISENLGINIRPHPLDMAGTLTFSWMFFSLIRKAPKKKLASTTTRQTENLAAKSDGLGESSNSKSSVALAEQPIPSLAVNYLAKDKIQFANSNGEKESTGFESVLANAKTDPDAAHALGIRFYYGRDIAKDYKIAFQLFRSAADAGHIESQYNIGLMYEDGDGIGRDELVAGYWYIKAARNNVVKAMNRLGEAYLSGDLGFTKDKVASDYWYGKSRIG